MSDFLRSILNKATASVVEEWRKEGKTTEEIDRIVKSRTETVMEDVIDKACNDYVEYMKAHMFENDLIWESRDAEFSSKQMQKWGKCFVASRMMYTMAIEIAEQYLKSIEDNPPDDFDAKRYTFHSLLHLHGRACQIFLEVLTLMKEGFADGAYARSRSLYEISCVASFIRKYGETVAEKYYKQSNASSTEKSYTWAQEVKDNKGNKVRSFSQIQELCDLPAPWKEGYDFTCLLAHASPQGTFGRISNGIDLNAIPVGRSDYGIKTPAEHSALCLQWISSVYLTLFPTMDSLSYAKVLSKWSDIIRVMYYTTHDEVFAEAIKAGKA